MKGPTRNTLEKNIMPIFKTELTINKNTIISNRMLSEDIRKRYKGKSLFKYLKSHKNIICKETIPIQGEKKEEKKALLCYYKLFFAKHITVRTRSIVLGDL